MNIVEEIVEIRSCTAVHFGTWYHKKA